MPSEVFPLKRLGGSRQAFLQRSSLADSCAHFVISLQPPLPLHSFLPFSAPQPPLPLHEFWPLQQCFSIFSLLALAPSFTALSPVSCARAAALPKPSPAM